MKIAADVLTKLKKFIQAGRCTQQELIQRLVQDPALRYKKEIIRLMVKEFLSQVKSKEQASKKLQQDVIIEDKIRKKKKVQNDYRYEPKLGHSLNSLGGIENIVEQIKDYVFLPIEKKQLFKDLNVQPSRGFMLIGSMGSGKTQLGFSILCEAKLRYEISPFYVTSSQLLKDAEEVLDKLFKSAIESEPSFIFIDDIHELCTKENRKQSSALNLLTAQLDKAQDAEIYILGSTSSPEKVDMALKRAGRFDKQITIENPNEQARTGILKKLLETVNTDIKGTESKISQATAGFVAADLVGLVKEAALQCVLRSSLKTQQKEGEIKPKASISEQDFKKALVRVQPLCKKQGFTMIPDVTLDDVGALGALKDELIKSIIIPIQQREKFKKMHVPLSAGLLLYGPPGCGKTMLAKAIANAAKANFITVKGPELLSKYVGESEESVRKVFQRAKVSAPCIIFFDEFDALAPKRQDQGNQVTERVVNTLLNELNGVEDRKMIFVIAATNRPDIIDEAILRSGRIEKHLLVPLPTQEDRVSILKAIVRKIDIGNICDYVDPDIPLEEIAKNVLCEGFSGADLHHLVKEACILAIMSQRQQLQQEDLLRSLEKIVFMKRKIG